jgi:hypothetical protein
MKAIQRVLVLITLVSLVGCTTLRPLPGDPAELRERIARGGVIGAGNHVRVTTVDGRNHDLVLVRVADGQLVGARESIAIDDVVAVSKEVPSRGKTIMLAIAIGVAVVVGAMYLALQHSGGFSLTTNTGG